MQEQEVWKDIPGYEDLYKVNQWGDIYSLYTNKKLKWSLHKDGYKQYNLSKNKKKYIMMAHRAVALAFISNPDNLPVVNHKDENKLNCDVSNLEWCTIKYNNNYSDNGKQAGLKTSKKIYCYNLDGSLFKIFESVRQSARFFKVNDGKICKSARWEEKGISKKFVVSVKGKIFSYEEKESWEVQERAKLSFDYQCRNNELSKPVLQYTLDGKKVQEFPSVNEARRKLNINSSQISRAARGYEKGLTCHGYRWKYKQ